MSAKPRQGKAWLLATAKAVAKELKMRREGTSLRIRMPRNARSVSTDGWSASIGDLGKGQPHIEIWFDRFSGYPERKLWACIASYSSRAPISAITKRVSKSLWPVRTISQADTSSGLFFALNTPLGRAGFNVPILEKYVGGQTFYGMYDPTRETADRVSPHFCERAASFFEDVARSLPNATVEDEKREVYPREENRQKVVSHLSRERSKLLATECKIRDNFECQVCSLRFEDDYGRLGSEFAEAHHRVPLSQLRESVRTRLEDLVTVCSNCHRMLHRMEGKREDTTKLKAIIRRHRA